MLDADVISTSIDRSQHRVLVVDDNPATRYTTARTLKASGFQTVEGGSGAEALAHARNGVSAVVLDVHLPDMSGFDVCRALRADAVTSTLPVVHLSAEFTRNEDRVAGLDAGADAYLIHPVEPAMLVATLQALIRARTAEERLRLSESRLRAIYDHAPSGIVVLDREGRVVDVNPAMLHLLGYVREELLGRPLPDIAPDSWQELAVAQMTTPDAQMQPWQGRLPLMRKDGCVLQLDWSMSSHVEPGLRIAIASDASEREELEQQRGEVLAREQAARATAERHSRTKDDFIAVLSHELRTPLNAIVGWVAVLMRRNPTPETAKGLEAIDRNVKAQARIISDILDVSRINSGKLHLEREPVDPAELVSLAVTSLRGSIDDKQLRVRLDVDQAHEPAFLDPARYQQIVWNLMTNAIKFSQKGSVIDVALRREGGRLYLEVQDQGQGIEPEFLGRLFDRFSQSDAPENRYHGGLGLGLSIVRHLAELHDGTVHASSAGLGHGTTMLVDIDAEGDLRKDYARSESTRDDDATGSFRPLEGVDVLVVEDDPDASEMLAVVLADRGAKVRLATNVETALLRMDEAWPDVLLSDIGLPRRDGYELIREVRALPPPKDKPRLPAIALTAFARAEDRAKAIDAGFDDHVPKPLNPHALVLAIRALLLTQQLSHRR